VTDNILSYGCTLLNPGFELKELFDDLKDKPEPDKTLNRNDLEFYEEPAVKEPFFYFDDILRVYLPYDQRVVDFETWLIRIEATKIEKLDSEVLLIWSPQSIDYGVSHKYEHSYTVYDAFGEYRNDYGIDDIAEKLYNDVIRQVYPIRDKLEKKRLDSLTPALSTFMLDHDSNVGRFIPWFHTHVLAQWSIGTSHDSYSGEYDSWEVLERIIEL
jgi:hypothetical protein